MPHERRWVAAWVARGAVDVFQYEKRFLTAGGEIVWAAIHLSLIEGESDGHFSSSTPSTSPTASARSARRSAAASTRSPAC